MRLRPPATPVPDPLLVEVRRRHPDVDVVVLPPAPPAITPQDDAQARLAETRDAVRAATATVLAAAGLDGHPDGHPDGPGIRYGATEGTVRLADRWRGVLDAPADGAADDPVDPLAAVEAELARHGWALHRVEGPVRRLAAVLDDLDVTVLHATSTGLLTLTVLGPEVAVGVAHARRLTARAA